MPRSARDHVPGVVYHLISRFVDREWFISKELERGYYLKLFGAAISQSDWRCLAYAVMSNHIHVAAVAGDDSLGSWIRRVHSPFADWMNRSHNRIGVMFVRGPKSVLIPDPGVGNVIAYIHNNPVRAKVVATAADTTWTSHRAYAELDRCPAWLDVTEGLQRSGVADLAAFDSLVASSPAHPVFETADSHEAFMQQLEAYEQAQLQAHQLAARATTHVGILDIVHIAADELAMPLSQLWSKRRGEAEVRARAVVIRCARFYGFNDVEVAAALRMSAQAVGGLARRYESNPRIDAAVNRVTKRLLTLEERDDRPEVIHTT